jgi:IrrE N-terminal-like domain
LRLKRLRQLIWVLLFAIPAMAAQGDARALCAQIPPIAEELHRISGMPLKHAVPCAYIDKQQINEFLKKRMKEVAKPEEVRAEELTLKLFGLVPADFNLAENTVDLLTEQAAAFYDYEKKKLFITDSTPDASQQPVLAHELAHAIADQNYNLSRFIKQGRKSDDGASARMAVMEGQATWLMSEFLAHRMGQSLKDSPGMVAAMAAMSDTNGSQFPVFDSSPLYLRMTLVFPYTKGMLFQHAVFEHEGQRGFGSVFLKPPVSTQQILHPEKYFSGVQPTSPALPDPKLGKGYKGLVGGTLGELDHEVMLEQYAGKEKAAELAPHWRGCAFNLVENAKAKRVVLLYAVEWDTEDAAREYFEAYQGVLQKKWKQMAVASGQPDAIDGTGDNGRFELRRSGRVVTSVEGLDPALR